MTLDYHSAFFFSENIINRDADGCFFFYHSLIYCFGTPDFWKSY